MLICGIIYSIAYSDSIYIHSEKDRFCKFMCRGHNDSGWGSFTKTPQLGYCYTIIALLIWRFVHPRQIILPEGLPEDTINCRGWTKRHYPCTRTTIILLNQIITTATELTAMASPEGNITCEGNIAGKPDTSRIQENTDANHQYAGKLGCHALLRSL